MLRISDPASGAFVDVYVPAELLVGFNLQLYVDEMTSPVSTFSHRLREFIPEAIRCGLEHEYRPPTTKQAHFAQTIAWALNIPLPDDALEMMWGWQMFMFDNLSKYYSLTRATYDEGVCP